MAVAELHPGDRRGAQPHRPLRRPRPHALPAGAERLPAHRPRQVDLPQLRPRPAVRRQVQPPLRRHQPHQGGAVEYVDSILDDVRWLGFDWEDRRALRLRLFRAALRVGRAAHQGGQGLRLRPDGRGDRQVPRHAERARQGQPLPQPHRRGEPRPVSAHEGRRVPRRLAHPAGPRSTWLAQLQPARPGHVPHPARAAPPHRRQVVHLPDVRLGARPVGFHRAHHPFHLHAGVREPPAALRLVRPGARHLRPAADRVRPP